MFWVTVRLIPHLVGGLLDDDLVPLPPGDALMDPWCGRWRTGAGLAGPAGRSGAASGADPAQSSLPGRPPIVSADAGAPQSAFDDGDRDGDGTPRP